MRLLVITAFYPPHHSGGYELRCKDVVEALRERGHEILVVTNRCTAPRCKLHSGEQGTLRALHLRTEAFTVVGQVLNDRTDLRVIDRARREFRPDIVYLWHIQNLSSAILPYLSCRPVQIIYDEGSSGLIFHSRMQKRGIYFFENERDPLLKKQLKRATYAIARMVSSRLIEPEWRWPENMRIYFNSQSALRHSQENGVPVDGAKVIPSGIDIGAFPYVERDHLRSPLVVLVPGRIKPEKGTKDAVRLLGELVRRGIPARLKVVGKIQSQEYFDEVMAAAREVGVDGLVEYHPMVGQEILARMYGEANICFFASYFRTGASRVPLEAMASGCLVLTYGNEGSRETVHDQDTGIIVSEGDIRSAAEAIRALQDRPGQYREIVCNARLQVEERFSFDLYLNEVERFLAACAPEDMASRLQGEPFAC